jgi:hypothetical protein
MIAEDHLLLVLHKAPRLRERQRAAAFFWRKPNGHWLHNSGNMGIQTLVKHLREYDDAESALGEQYQQAQDAEDYFRLLEAIAPLRLATKNLHVTLQAAREGIPYDKDIIDLRDWAYDMDRTLDLLYENTKNALDFRVAQRAEEQTRLSLKSLESGNRLNILAAIFLPLTAVSAVFGMNLTSGLEDASVAAFWITAALGIGLGLWVRHWVTTGRWM